MEKRLYRDEYRKKVAGVCAGLSEYFTVDVAIVRLIFVVACFIHGIGILPYIVLWIVLPKKPHPFMDPTVDYTVPPQNPTMEDSGTSGSGQFSSGSFQNRPFTNQPFTNQPFSQPYTNQPFPPKRGPSTATVIIGTVLIMVGGLILLEQLDIWPDWEYWKLWPIVPITVGLILMISGGTGKKKFDEDATWQQAQEVKPEETKPEEAKPDTAASPDNEPKA
jgi:phage shock protein C